MYMYMVYMYVFLIGLIKQFLRDVDWGELDYLLVDTPPGTSDEHLSIVQYLSNVDGAVVMTTPQVYVISDNCHVLIYTNILWSGFHSNRYCWTCIRVCVYVHDYMYMFAYYAMYVNRIFSVRRFLYWMSGRRSTFAVRWTFQYWVWLKTWVALYAQSVRLESENSLELDFWGDG